MQWINAEPLIIYIMILLAETGNVNYVRIAEKGKPEQGLFIRNFISDYFLVLLL